VKKIIWAILISAALIFGFASCDDGAAGGGGGALNGTWKWATSTYYGGPVSYNHKLIFKSSLVEERWTDKLERSGTYILVEKELNITWTWSFDGMGLGNNGGYTYDPITEVITWKLSNDIRTYTKQ
jgi:hypothetical protein